MRKILYISASPNISGAERSLLITMTNLKHYEPLLVVPQKGLLGNTAEKYGIRVFILPELIEQRKTLNPFKLYRNFKLLKIGIEKLVYLSEFEKIEMIHANSLNSLLYGGWAAKKCHIPAILHLRDIVQSPLTKIILNILTNILANRTIAISKATAKQLCVKKRTVLIYNSYEQPKKISINIVQRLKQKKIIMVARYKKWKGQENFIKVALRLLAKDSSYIFEIYGDHNKPVEHAYYKKLYQMIPAEFRKKIIFKGFENDLCKIYQHATLLLHLPQRPEPFGRIVLEAGLFRVPVIAAAAGGLKEIITQHKDGFLVQPSNHKKIVKVIEYLLADQKRYELYGKYLYNKVIKNFSLSQHIAKIEKLYGELINVR
jgi:glycosyltransferase involved in cell wall biosynthesis